MDAEKVYSDGIEKMAATAADDPVALSALLTAVGPARIPQPIREQSAAALKALATSRPAVLAAREKEIAELLESDNAFTRMAMLHVIGDLACADRSVPLERLTERILDHLADEKVSVAGHVLIVAAEIARSRPELAGRITERILALGEVASRPERIGLLRSYAIEALDAYLAPADRTAEVVEFVSAGRMDDSPKTRKLAAEVLRRWGIS